MKRRFIKGKEAKKLLTEFLESSKIRLRELDTPKTRIEIASSKQDEIFLIDGKPFFARSDDSLIPVLSSKQVLSRMPKAIVNMGAVPYLCNGADVMAPGIVSFEGVFDKGDYIVILDELHKTPITIAKALFNKEEAKKLEHGKVFKNVHYVGDQLWKKLKKLSSA
ncbi:MAG: DUF1947 domain-containing protein [Candidatus Bathyarchaeota archaeon]|nr:MAG: DUF1947 domain-containing protein [Candidatus Bathyarchaeota archaeon]